MKNIKKMRIAILAASGLIALAGCSQGGSGTDSQGGAQTSDQGAGSADSQGGSGTESHGGASSGELVNNITEEQIAPYKTSPLTLTLWTPIVGPDASYFQDIVMGWNAQYGDWIHIKSEALEEESHYTRILTSFNDNSTGDICFIHKQRIARYYRTGKLRDVSSIVKNAGIAEDQYIDGAWDDGMFDNKQVGLAIDYLPTLLFYNKKLIPEGYTEADILSDDFTYEKLCEMSANAYIHNRVVSKRTYGFAFNYGYCEEPFISNLAGLGGEPVKASDPTVPLYNNDLSFKAVKAIESIPFTFNAAGQKVSSESGSDHRKVFNSGRALFTMDGLWSASSLVYHNDKVDTGVAFLPKVNSYAERVAYSDAHMFVAFNNKNVSTARDGAISLFLKYYTDNSLHWCKSGKVASRKDTAQSAEYKQLPWSFVSDSFSSVVTPSKIYSYQTITSHAAETISEICEGKGQDGERYSDAEIQSKLDQSVSEAKNLVAKL